jgi:hypothetical protein
MRLHYYDASNKLQGVGALTVFISIEAAQPPPNKRKHETMKALALSTVIAVGLLCAGSALADTAVYSSKTTQNVSFAPSSGGPFDGTYISSKSGSQLLGPTVAQAGKTDKRVACSRRAQMTPADCARHCSLAVN